MADILAFPAVAGRRAPDLEVPRGKARGEASARRAEIIIFPGVRIERHEFLLAERLPRHRPAGGSGKPRHGRG